MNNKEEIIVRIKEEIESHESTINDSLCVKIILQLVENYPDLLKLYLAKIDAVYKENADDEGFVNIHLQVLQNLNKKQLKEYLKIVESQLKKRVKSMWNNDLEMMANFFSKSKQFKKAEFWINKIAKDSSHRQQALDFLKFKSEGETRLEELLSQEDEVFNLSFYFELVKPILEKDKTWYSRIIEHVLTQLEIQTNEEVNNRMLPLLFRFFEENADQDIPSDYLDRFYNVPMNLTSKFYFIKALIEINRGESAQKLYNKTIKEYAEEIKSGNSDSSSIMAIAPFLGEELKIRETDSKLYLEILDNFSGFQKKDFIVSLLNCKEIAVAIENKLLTKFSEEISTGVVLARTGRIKKALEIDDLLEDSKFQIIISICDYFSDDQMQFNTYLAKIDSERIQAETILNAVEKINSSHPNIALAYLEQGKKVIHDLITYHKSRYSREFCVLSVILKSDDLFYSLFHDLTNSTDKIYCLTRKLMNTVNTM